MKILLAEDDRASAFLFQSGLEKRGHEVVWILGVEKMPTDPKDIVWGIGTDNTIVEFKLTDFDAAFIDGNLKGKIHGRSITRRLAEIGIKSCAISSKDPINREMEESGATTSCLKYKVIPNLDTILSKLS